MDCVELPDYNPFCFFVTWNKDTL